MTQTSLSRSRGKKALLLAGSFLAAVVIIVLFWVHSLNIDPVVHVPTPVMPSPNAFDDFVAAGNTLRDGTKIAFAESQQPGQSLTGPFEDHHRYTLAEKTALVSENAQALSKLRRGFQHQYYCPPIRSIDTPVTYLPKFRDMAYLLALEAQIRQAKGDWGEADDSALDAMEFGAVIAHGSPEYGELTGRACQGIGRHRMWGAVDHLSTQQLHSEIQRLEEIEAQQTPLSDTLLEEKWYLQASLAGLFRLPDWPQHFLNDYGIEDNVASRLAKGQLRFMAKQTIMDDLTHYMDQLIANAKKPYADHIADPPVPDDPVNAIIFEDHGNIRIHYVDSETHNRLLLLALALRAYKVERNSYPVSLTALVPGYLKALPDDPFSLSGTFRYRRVGKNFVLYSVGPDGNDDGGKQIVDTTLPVSSRARYATMPDSKGDIVAGQSNY